MTDCGCKVGPTATLHRRTNPATGKAMVLCINHAKRHDSGEGFVMNANLPADVLDTILTALHERRNRLISVDATDGVNIPSRPTLRTRINEVNRAITVLNGGKHA